jgi:hypothetical protein
MKVSIKDLTLAMPLGTKGIELDVYDSKGSHLGDLRIGKATIEWCKGRTRTGNGVLVGWPDLIGWFESTRAGDTKFAADSRRALKAWETRRLRLAEEAKG